jgi:hypothetical protein
MDNRNYPVIILLFSQHIDDKELRIIILLGKKDPLLYYYCYYNWYNKTQSLRSR